MRKILILLLVFLVQAFGCLAFITRTNQTTSVQPGEAETLEVQKIARAFMARLQETRDLAPLLKEFYADDFIKRLLPAAPKSSKQFATLDFASEFPIGQAALNQASVNDWETLYVGYQNLRYYMVLSIATLPEKRGVPAKTVFPPEVEKLLKTQSRFVESGIHTLKDLRALNGTLKQAGAIMRQRFKQNPPEQTALYKERIGQFLERYPDIMKVFALVSSQTVSGFPPQTRFFNIITEAPFFELRLAQTHQGMKIIFARMYPYN